MSDYKSPAISTAGTEMSRYHALIDARDIIRELGLPITIRLHKETNVERDRFNSIKNRDASGNPGTTFYSFPIIYNPTTKDLEDSGIREKTEVLIKTAMLDWNDAGYTLARLNDIDSIRATVIINNVTYEIRDKQFDSQYYDTYLYVHLGLNRI